MIANPGPEYRCDVRWWLAEGMHTDETLKKEIRDLSDHGFGAAEFLAMDEVDADSTRYGWGSEEWIHDTQVVIEEATGRGMGASMTCGTNWSNANLPDFVHMPDDRSASKELDFTVERMKPGQIRSGALPMAELLKENVTKQELIAVVAAKILDESENRIYLHTDTIVLTDQVHNGSLTWTAPEDGEYLLVIFWMHGTGQTASPSVSVSYTINYIDRYGADKLIAYWDQEVLTPQLREYIRKNGRIQMYMDSLELAVYGNGGHLWGYHLLEEFSKRRGYDLVPYLPFILRQVKGMAMGPIVYWYEMQDQTLADKVRTDFYQTLTDMYMESTLKPLQEWLHKTGMTLRSEISYGLPFEISQPGKYVDGIETESLEFASQIDSYRGLAGAAHLYNKVFSSETGATKMNYALGLDFYTQIIYTQFAAGVTKTVLHGYSSICGAPGSTQWPGHEGMWPVFSERFGERQPAYRHYKDWTAMIARYQKLLRSGKPRRDIGVLRLDYNFYNTLFRVNDEEHFYGHELMRANEGIYWKDTSMQNMGYSYDYFSPQLLDDPDIIFGDGVLQPEGPAYQAILIYQEYMPVDSARILLKYAQGGLPVVLANGITETVQTQTDVHHKQAACRTPFNDGKDEELCAIMEEMKSLPNVRVIDDPANAVQALKELGVTPRAGFQKPNNQVLTLMRQDGDWKYVYAYNYMYTREEPAVFTLRIEGVGRPYRIDCWTQEVTELEVYTAEDGYTMLEVTLEPGQAAMFALDTREISDVHVIQTNANDVQKVNGGLAFIVRETGRYEALLSDKRRVVKDIQCRKNIQLNDWNLVVEDWNEGDQQVIEEDRGLGYVTREVYFETRKDRIEVGSTTLEAWKDIRQVGPEVSGVGYYSTTVVMPEDWGNNDGAELSIASTNGNTAAVYVNGQKASAYDFDKRRIDLTELLHPGDNEIMVEVSSTLANRLYQRGYYENMKEISRLLMKMASGESEDGGIIEQAEPVPRPQPYGMTGKVELITYKVAAF